MGEIELKERSVTLEELEAKLVQAGVLATTAKMIATMALDHSIERHEKGWFIPTNKVVVPYFPRPGQSDQEKQHERVQQDQQRGEALRAIIGAVIHEKTGTIGRQFMAITDLLMARGNAFLCYRFSREFITWAELAQNEPDILH